MRIRPSTTELLGTDPHRSLSPRARRHTSSLAAFRRRPRAASVDPRAALRRALRPGAARRQAVIPGSAAPQAVASQRRARLRLRWPHLQRGLRRHHRPRPDPDRRPGRRRRRLVRRRRLPEVHALDRVRRRAAVRRRPRARVARRRRRSSPRPGTGSRWLAKMWDRAPRPCYLQVGIGSGNAAGTFFGDHDLLAAAAGRRPRPRARWTATSPHRPVFQRHRPASRSARTWSAGCRGVRARRAGRRARPHRAGPGTSCARPRSLYAHGRHRVAAAPAGDRAAPRVLPGVDLARRHGARRGRDRARAARRCTVAPRATSPTPRTGRATTCARTPATRSTSTTPARWRTPTWRRRWAQRVGLAVTRHAARGRPAAPAASVRSGAPLATRSRAGVDDTDFDVDSHTFGLIATEGWYGRLTGDHALRRVRARDSAAGCSARTPGAPASWSASARRSRTACSTRSPTSSAATTARRRSTSARSSTAPTAPTVRRAAWAASRTAWCTARGAGTLRGSTAGQPLRRRRPLLADRRAGAGHDRRRDRRCCRAVVEVGSMPPGRHAGSPGGDEVGPSDVGDHLADRGARIQRTLARSRARRSRGSARRAVY